MMSMLMLFVGAHMAVHVAICGKSEMTIFTVEWSFTGVHQNVTIQ